MQAKARSGERPTPVAAQPAPSARRIWRRRSGAQRLVLAATGATVLILSFALTAIVGYGIRTPVAATRTTFATGAQADITGTLTATADRNGESQDAAVRHIIAATFHGAPITVTHRVIPATLNDDASAVWTISPAAKSVVPSDLDRLANGFAHIDEAVSTSAGARSSDAKLSGRAAATLHAMRGSVAAVDAILPIPLIALLLAGLIALVLCARLLATTRENESRLLRARGGSVGTLVRADTRESLGVSLVGALAGTVAAQVLLWYTVGVPDGPVDLAAAPIAAFVASIAVSIAVAATTARNASGPPRPSTGRARSAVSWSFAVLLLAVAAITLWRFLLFGAPTAGRPDDAAAVLAPAALLTAAAMTGLVSLTPLAGAVARWAARSPGLATVLPARQIHRNLGFFAGPVALLILAIGTSTVASAYTATWSGYLRDSAHIVNGSDLRASFGGQALVTGASELLDVDQYRRLGNVTAVAPVRRETDSVGDDTVTMIGVSARELPALANPGSSVLDAAALSRVLTASAHTVAQRGLPLPAGASRITLGVLATEFAETAPPLPDPDRSVTTTLWLENPDGALVPVQFPVVPIGSAATARPVAVAATVPSDGPWTVVAVDGVITATTALTGFEFRVASVGVSVGGAAKPIAIPPTQAWPAQARVFGGEGTIGKPGVISFAQQSIPGDVIATAAFRLMPKASALVPIVVSEGLAKADGLRVGSRIDIDAQWASFSGTVAGVVPLVPGVTSDASLIADLPALDNGWLRGSEQVPALHELWIASTAPGNTQVSIATLPHPPAQVTDATGTITSRFVDAAVTGLWLGAAGCAAFAIIALAAAVAAIMRRRSGEIAVLRALGLSATEQARSRRFEVALIGGYSLVVGVATGVIVCAFTIATLARSSTPAAPSVLFVQERIDFVALGALLLTLAVAGFVVELAYEAAVRLRAGARGTAGVEK